MLTEYFRKNDNAIALYWLPLSKLRLDEFSNIGKVFPFFLVYLWDPLVT